MGFMSTNMRRYYALERRLLELRKSSGSDDPPGADAILDEMDDMWLLLSDAEHKKLNEGPSRTFPSNWGAITGLMSPAKPKAASDLSPTMLSLLVQQCRRGWWRWEPEDRPLLPTFRALERLGLVWRKNVVPMFQDVPGDRCTISFPTKDGWEEVESLGIPTGWSRPFSE